MLGEKKKFAKLFELKKEEKDKHTALLVLVIFFMILIVVLWAMNLGATFSLNKKKATDKINVDQLTKDFQTSFNDVEEKMNQLKMITPEELKKYPLQGPLVTPTSTSASSSRIKVYKK